MALRAPAPSERKRGHGTRIQGIDVARGLAALIMIQGHGYDAYVLPEEKSSFAYGVTRFLGTFPLPAFLVLAGASLTLRFHSAVVRNEDENQARKRVLQRGLQLVAVGYLVQGVFALIDGWDSYETLFRADVLQCIGLGLLLLGALWTPGWKRKHSSRHGRKLQPWLLRCGAVGVLVTLLCPPLTQLGAHVPWPLSYFLAPIIDVPNITRMPVVPLIAWCAGGAGVTGWMLRSRGATTDPKSHARGASIRTLLGIAVAAAFLTVLAAGGTQLLLPEEGLTRGHPIVWLNVVDLLGRGVLVLALGALLSGFLPARILRLLLQFGRASLWAYVFHLPLCYGSLGTYVAGKLTMLEATWAVLVLVVLSYGAVLIRAPLLQLVRNSRRWTEGVRHP